MQIRKQRNKKAKTRIVQNVDMPCPKKSCNTREVRPFPAKYSNSTYTTYHLQLTTYHLWCIPHKCLFKEKKKSLLWKIILVFHWSKLKDCKIDVVIKFWLKLKLCFNLLPTAPNYWNSRHGFYSESLSLIESFVA